MHLILLIRMETEIRKQETWNLIKTEEWAKDVFDKLRERNRMQSNFSTLCRGHIIPKELNKETAAKFMEAAEQFERIINDSGFVRLRRLSTDEIVGTDGKAGLIERYFSLMPEGDATLQDIDLSAREMRIGDNRLCLHTLSDAEDLPGTVATDTRYEKLSTDRSDCRLSFAFYKRCDPA